MADPAFPRPAGSVRLLVAEDEPHIRRILITLLESAGFTVDSARTGSQAVEYLQGSVTYDIILLDLMMPGLSGLEVLEQLRELPAYRTTPVIILSAKGQDADRERALELGASDFLTKPFSPKKLVSRLDQLLAQR